MLWIIIRSQNMYLWLGISKWHWYIKVLWLMLYNIVHMYFYVGKIHKNTICSCCYFVCSFKCWRLLTKDIVWMHSYLTYANTAGTGIIIPSSSEILWSVYPLFRRVNVFWTMIHNLNSFQFSAGEQSLLFFTKLWDESLKHNFIGLFNVHTTKYEDSERIQFRLNVLWVLPIASQFLHDKIFSENNVLPNYWFVVITKEIKCLYVQYFWISKISSTYVLCFRRATYNSLYISGLATLQKKRLTIP